LLAGFGSSFGLPFGLSGSCRFAADLAPDLPYLTGEVLFYVIPPDDTTRAVLVRALFQADQLLAPFPNQRVQPKQFGFKLRRHLQFAIRCHQSECPY
jgi:hypothetical protein